MNIDLEFNPQMLLVGINYNTSSDVMNYYSTWEVYIFCLRLVIEKSYKL